MSHYILSAVCRCLSVSQMKVVDIPRTYNNTARAPNIKADSPEVKEVVDFADRLWYVLSYMIILILLSLT